MAVVSTSPGREKNLPLLATFGAVLVLIGAAAAMFVGSYNGQKVAGLASRVQQLERAIGSAEAARVYLTQAAYLAGEPGAADTLMRTVAAAKDSLAATTSELEVYFQTSDADASGLTALADTYVERSGQALDLVEKAQITAAAQLIGGGVKGAHSDLEAALLNLQRADAAVINQTSSALGRIADVVRFLMAFALPAAGMMVYRWVSNRQRRNAEIRLRLESEKAINRSKDEFIANVSHELRTPLTGIIGFAQLLTESDLKPGDQEVVGLIVDQSADLSRMVDDLLTAARADANALTINPRSVAISDEVGEAVRFVSLMRTDVEINCQDATVVIDPERFRQVLRNLLVNARKHGGSRIKVRGSRKADSYVCTVIDDGPGVPAHVQERLFSRFVHTGEAPVLMGSVGLGLAIVHELCRLMDCEVSYRRVRGETWFSVTMPLAPVQEATSVLDLVAV